MRWRLFHAPPSTGCGRYAVRAIRPDLVVLQPHFLG